ncbi:hypothetical protein [Streptomyces sp. NPDC059262]|uniref:hypothetical protein n=1 Tax=Streptomyces sp. NPDC059262 TaxID=3346797 RepID=UPI00367B7776
MAGQLYMRDAAARILGLRVSDCDPLVGLYWGADALLTRQNQRSACDVAAQTPELPASSRSVLDCVSTLMAVALAGDRICAMARFDDHALPWSGPPPARVRPGVR